MLLKGGLYMKKLSINKLATTVKTKREQKEMTQDQLSELTGINRVMIGRIEHQDFIPSINQLESLSNILNFDITDMFDEQQSTNSFIALRSEALNENEKEGVDKLFSMMLALRKQLLLRSK